MSYTNRGNCGSLFLIKMAFIAYSCLFALVRTSSTVLNRGHKNENPSFYPDLEDKLSALKALWALAC
jgi:hypothetical protein